MEESGAQVRQLVILLIRQFLGFHLLHNVLRTVGSKFAMLSYTGYY